MWITVALLIFAACLACFLAGIAVRGISTRSTQGDQIMVDLNALAVDVAAIKDVTLSAKTALDGLIDRFEDASTSGDPDALAAAITEARAASEALAASVATIPPEPVP